MRGKLGKPTQKKACDQQQDVTRNDKRGWECWECWDLGHDKYKALSSHNIEYKTLSSHNIEYKTLSSHNIEYKTLNPHNIEYKTLNPHNIEYKTLNPHNIEYNTFNSHNIRYVTAVTPNFKWLHTLMFFRQPVPIMAASFLALLCVIPPLPSLLDSSQLFEISRFRVLGTGIRVLAARHFPPVFGGLGTQC